MKYLSANGYSIHKDDLLQEDLQAVKDELSVKPFLPQGFEEISTIKPFKLYQEGPTKIYVPRFYGVKKFGVPDQNKLDDGEQISIAFNGSLRKEQSEPVEAFMKAVEDPVQSGGILNLTCASGKTVMAIYLMCKMARKTMVVVHKDFLLEQWKERIAQFATNARIGLIKAKVVDIEDKDIVLASLQSLSMKQYPPELFKSFGFVVVDEVHHTSAEVFSRALRKIAFKYTLGLSATIQRKDGLSKVFKWYLGPVLYSNVSRCGKKQVVDTVNIVCKHYYTPDPAYSKEETMMRDKLNISRMINNVCEYHPRMEYVVGSIEEIMREEPDRRVIVLSDRRMHLECLGTMLKDKGYTCGNYFGGMRIEDLKASESAQIILGTFCMVSEGFDCKCLDTLVLASPKSDVVQSVGRILREEASKRRHIPTVIDIMDGFSIFQKQAMKRLKYYKSQKYQILGDIEIAKNNKLVRLEGPCFIDLEKIDKHLV